MLEDATSNWAIGVLDNFTNHNLMHTNIEILFQILVHDVNGEGV